MFDINPNWFAYFALLIWPVVAVCLYSRLPIARATLWTVLGGYLLLPVGTVMKIQMVPEFDKSSIPNLSAFLCCTLFARRLPKIFRGFGLPEISVLAIIIGPFISSMLNTDPIQIGRTSLPGVGAYDAGSAVIFQFIFMLPFFLGRQFLRRPEDSTEILRILVIAGLVYSLPMLFEIRMSPQLHLWVYGYFPHSFFQQIRDNGFRPVVFLGHGLIVAFFAMTTSVAAAALWRTNTRVTRFSAAGITAYLSFVLVLCKSAGALVYGLVLVPLTRWARPALQLRIATILVSIALCYPMLRVAGLVPTTSILETAQSIDADRAASLGMRFSQEKMLLDHAWQRPWFGWGRFGRGRVYDSDGVDISTTDGHWINVMADFGLFSFFAQFGLLALVVYRAAGALKLVSTAREKEHLAALTLIVAINIFDLIPNSSISPWTWLLVGALLGQAEALHVAVRKPLPNANLQQFASVGLQERTQN